MHEMPVLETERLLIRPFQQEDLQAIHYILDVELAPVEFGNQGAMSEPDRRSWLEWTIAGYRQLAELYQPPYGDRAVMLKTRTASSSTLIGAAGFVPSFAPFGKLPSFGGEPSQNSAAPVSRLCARSGTRHGPLCIQRAGAGQAGGDEHC